MAKEVKQKMNMFDKIGERRWLVRLHLTEQVERWSALGLWSFGKKKKKLIYIVQDAGVQQRKVVEEFQNVE